MIIENNFLTEEELNVTQEHIIDNMDFPWYRIPHSTSEKYPFYAHSLLAREEFVDDEHPALNSPWFDFFLSILHRFVQKHKLYKGDYQIMRSSINDTLSFPDKGCDPHIDFFEEHLVVMLYLTESSGDTIFYTKEWKDGDPPSLLNEKNFPNLRVKQKITPEIGKVICYNGLNYHSHNFKKPNERRIVCVFGIRGERNE